MMKSKINFLMVAIIVMGFAPGSRQDNNKSSQKVIGILENEKWWGGAVLDGRNLPLSEKYFLYDQDGNCKGNQAAPLFISNKGRYIWSEKPLKIEISNAKITVKATRGDIITGKSGETLKDAFLYASRQFFPPSGKTPDSLLFKSPQYNTWIELQYNQNEKDILKYANDIVKNGFPTGVIMIDDNWQDRYGTWNFDCEKFSDPKGMIDKLHKLGFKVMLWVVPFISSDSPIYRKLAEKKMLIFEDKEKTKPAKIEWWNGVSALVDLSNPEGERWFKDQLNNLVTTYGVDGFKLDAGDPEFYIDRYSSKDFDPNEHCEAYARIGLDFPLNELRACWKMAGQALVQRLRDKSHTWGDVQVLIPDMTGLGLIGHQFGCPDLIGGGEWTSFQDTSVLDEELIVRSTQVSTLMPMMQFSVAPWRVLSKENLTICKNMADLHFNMGPEIMELARQCAVSGEPMVRNLEYEFPGKGYEEIKDQFLLGDKILVAPVVQNGQRSREVFFPKGKWHGDDGSVVDGPAKIKIEVPLERLPWYRKLAEDADPFPVSVVNIPEMKKVEMTVRNTLFTSYMYADTIEKPILFPVVAADGITVTRGYPILPRVGEVIDHPHQTGFWFNYGNVNGIDFWGNSKWLPAKDKAKCGIIRFINIDSISSLSDKGILAVNQEWIGPDGSVPITEHTIYNFRAGNDYRIIDHFTTLTAQEPVVSFTDTKEGAFAIRVARFLEFPSKEPKIFVDAQGMPAKVPVINNEGVTGNYLSSEGVEGAGVWSTRARWMMLYGVSGPDTISLVFMDHPSNLNYPTFWHARDYGLFSANPFGQKDFTQGKEELNFKMKKGESVTFKHRLFIKSGKRFTTADIEKEWKNFIENVK